MKESKDNLSREKVALVFLLIVVLVFFMGVTKGWLTILLAPFLSRS